MPDSRRARRPLSISVIIIARVRKGFYDRATRE